MHPSLTLDKIDYFKSYNENEIVYVEKRNQYEVLCFSKTFFEIYFQEKCNKNNSKLKRISKLV